VGVKYYSAHVVTSLALLSPRAFLSLSVQVDFPAAMCWEALAKAYPDAQVIAWTLRVNNLTF
jgi:hypothetical protein